MSTIAPRFAWMAETLPLRPADRVLEVGCGHGIALGLIAARLTSGTVTGIDRSPKMIAAATRRNAALIQSAQVRLRTASLHELDDPPGAFDLICAMNVASLWTRPERDLVVARLLLAPGGRLCLFAQLPPWAADGATWLETTRWLLGRYSLLVETRSANVDPHPVGAVIGRIDGGPDRT
jgi:SAM-dependent methyltransferase